MNIALFGATGGTGREFLKQALNRGHEITAIVRDPKSLDIRHPHLRVLPGDVLWPDTFGEKLKGKDAVVSTVGISSFLKSLRPMTFHQRSIGNITGQMRVANAHRLLCVTSTGVIHNPTAPLFYNLLVQPLLRHKYEDMRRMEEVVEQSGLEWTVVRPFRLTDGPRTEDYRTATNGTLKHAGWISRADVADLLLRSVENGLHIREKIAVAY